MRGQVSRDVFTLGLAFLLAQSDATRAQDVPPPPPPKKDNEPALGDTLKFIRDKLNAQGRVSRMVIKHDHSKGQYATERWSSLVSDATTNVAACTLSFRTVLDVDTDSDQSRLEQSVKLSFRDLDKLAVEPETETRKREFASLPNGVGPFTLVSVDPEVFSVVLYANGGKIHISTSIKQLHFEGEADVSLATLAIRDEDMAQRMAKAMIHAIELCGGGSKDVF
ncbi:MAG: hypothetical protein WBW33_06390 [Bryobacteraceae bacterium]